MAMEDRLAGPVYEANAYFHGPIDAVYSWRDAKRVPNLERQNGAIVDRNQLKRVFVQMEWMKIGGFVHDQPFLARSDSRLRRAFHLLIELAVNRETESGE